MKSMYECSSRYIRIFCIALAMVLMLGIVLIPDSSYAVSEGVKVRLDNKALTFDVPPQIIDGRTMVPMRTIFEKLGLEVEWDESTSSITAIGGDTTIYMTIGNNIIYKNGEAIYSDAAPLIKDGRTLVPLRIIVESLGAAVSWNWYTQTASIFSDPDSAEAQSYIKGQQIADYACDFVGGPYKYAGNSLTTGTDCSGFVKLIYAHFGYNVSRSSSGLRADGREVSYESAQPGDVICYSGHVAMYLGEGGLVHARNEALGIAITPDAKYRTILTVRRIV